MKILFGNGLKNNLKWCVNFVDEGYFYLVVFDFLWYLF